MELYDSLKIVFIVQKLSRHSIAIFDKKGIRYGRFLLLANVSSLLSMMLIASRLSYVAVTNLDSNPLDQSLFSSLVSLIPIFIIFIMMVALWSAGILLKSRDLDILQLLFEFDKSFGKILDLQTIYRKFKSSTVKQVFGIVLLPLMFNLPFHLSRDQGSVIFHRVFFSTTVISFMFSGVTFTFAAYIKVVCDRLNAIAAAKVNRAVDLINLVEAEKKLTIIIQKLNGSLCIKQSFVVISNWSVIIVMSYMLLITAASWNENSPGFIFIIIPSAIPHIFMLFTTFYCGQVLELTVSFTETHLVGRAALKMFYFFAAKKLSSCANASQQPRG